MYKKYKRILCLTVLNNCVKGVGLRDTIIERSQMHKISDMLIKYSLTTVYINSSFFPHIAKLWNSLPIECFLLAYDLNGFKGNA